MEYKTKDQEKYAEEALTVIKKHKIALIDHIWAFTSFCKKTAYNHSLHELHHIKEELNNNKSKAKNYMLNKWIASPNATLNIAAYRLLAESEEHQKLNQSYIDHTTKGQSIKTLTPKEAAKIAKDLDDDY